MSCDHKNAYQGDCCCNCKRQKRLHCHPWNESVGKGAIIETMGFVCTAPELYEDGVIFFEEEHGMCEMHERQQEVKEQA